ncbi:hypothetical protein ACHHY8_18785 [Enterobacter cloacae complex sp. 2024EL-00215]|uniref:hypothetical protein n=1 Tax=unclassified Enterobacter cloacae complex TaxID=2757714 RepID=UPI0037521F30
MKLYSKVLVVTLCLISTIAHAAKKDDDYKKNYDDFYVGAVRTESGVMWYHDKSYYYDEFKLNISNTGSSSGFLPHKTCFVLFDGNSDRKVIANGADGNLFKKYQPYETKTGAVIFRNEHKETLSGLSLIKLSQTECDSISSNFIRQP